MVKISNEFIDSDSSITKSGLKKDKNSTRPEVSQKIGVKEQYLNKYYLRQNPNLDKFVPDLIERYIEWARFSTGHRFYEFLEEEGLNSSSFREWMVKYPDLKKAHEMCLMILGNKMWKGAATRKLEPTSVHKLLGAYAEDWADQEAKRAQLTKHTDAPVGTIVNEFVNYQVQEPE